MAPAISIPDTFADAFGPVREERIVTDLPVSGRVPKHLDGRYVRIGPNPVEEIDPATYHLLAGDGMAHGVRLRDGRAEWYRNRWIRSPEVATALGERPPKPNYRAGVTLIAANTNVIGHAGRTLALVEGGAACYELDDELRTVSGWDFAGTITGGWTAHPKRDPHSGDLHAISYSAMLGKKVRYSVIDPTGRAVKTVDVPVTGNAMVHDMALTENYVLIYDLPLELHTAGAIAAAMPRLLRHPAQSAISALLNRGLKDRLVPLTSRATGALFDRKTILAQMGTAIRWNPGHPPRVGVLPRNAVTGKEVRWFEVEPCFVFHTLNAYEHDGSIVCDVVALPEPRSAQERTDAPQWSIANILSLGPRLHRWQFNLATGSVSKTPLADETDGRVQEFPRIDERLIGAPHRYGYTTANPFKAVPDVACAIQQHDLQAGTLAEHTFGPNVEVGEFSFVPTTPDSAENDGVLIGFTNDRQTGRSNLTLVAADSLEEIASIHLPVRVPSGFHGNWIPNPSPMAR